MSLNLLGGKIKFYILKFQTSLNSENPKDIRYPKPGGRKRGLEQFLRKAQLVYFTHTYQFFGFFNEIIFIKRITVRCARLKFDSQLSLFITLVICDGYILVQLNLDKVIKTITNLYHFDLFFIFKKILNLSYLFSIIFSKKKKRF